MDKGAILVTLDQEFTVRRRKNTIGRHVRIDCPEPDAADLLAKYHNDIVPMLDHHANITIELRPEGIHTFHNWD